MTWVDTHCHLFGATPSPGELIDRAKTAGVDWMVCPGIDLETSRQAAELAVQFEGIVFATAGLHPHYADRWPAERAALATLAEGAVAVGECGLDFYRNLAPRDAQLQAFREQLSLARELGKPVIVHCRDAFAEVYDEIAGHDNVVLHCWTGGPKWTRRFAELGVTFSFAGPIAYETGDGVRRAAAVAPRDRTMIETDTPYLSPPPHRGEENEPARVTIVGEALADVWGVPAAEVAELTSGAAAAVFL